MVNEIIKYSGGDVNNGVDKDVDVGNGDVKDGAVNMSKKIFHKIWSVFIFRIMIIILFELNKKN